VIGEREGLKKKKQEKTFKNLKNKKYKQECCGFSGCKYI